MRRTFLYALTFFLGQSIISSPAPADTMTVVGSTGGAFSVRVVSFKESRFRSTIRQQYDFSCGSAAVATLLTFHYEKPVSEQEVFDAMFSIGNQQKIRAQGFSLLDMKNYLDSLGFNAGGYQASLDKLAALGVPAIVLININGYKHFVVVKGVSKSEVLLSDPAVGSRSMPRSEFEAMWNGLLFLVRNRKDQAKNHFNQEKEWQIRSKAPLGTALSNSELIDVNLLFR